MSGCDRLVDVGRRRFLKGGALASAAAAMGGTKQAKATPTPALLDYPGQRLANISELTLDEPLYVSYPDENSPGVLLKLGAPAADGVGPDGDIVAFSILCPHKGYPLNYVAENKTLNCPGHYSVFDAEKGGFQVWGQATQNLPQFKLRVDEGGDIYATGVDELLYGRVSNILPG